MPDWKTIENILLRGRPCNGEQLKDLIASDLLSEITVPTASGESARYRKTGQCEAGARGEHGRAVQQALDL